jgi:hypothetical protein
MARKRLENLPDSFSLIKEMKPEIRQQLIRGEYEKYRRKDQLVKQVPIDTQVLI